MRPMKGLTTCAVQGCPNKPDGYANLCGLHKQPGAIAQIEGSTMVVTSWLVRHGEGTGMVILNDYSIGNLHGGAEGFRAQLEAQGFTDNPPAGDAKRAAYSPAEGAGHMVRALAHRVPLGEGPDGGGTPFPPIDAP